MQQTSTSRRLPGWLILLGAMMAIGPLSIDMYLPALPIIGTEFDTYRQELTLAVYLIGMSAGQLLYGPISDRFGRKPPLYFALTLYLVAALGCAFAHSLEALVVWRLLQALGGCAGVVISRAVVRDRSDTQEAARAYSLLLLVMGVAPILAPSLGGLILSFTGWRGIFLFLAAFAAVLLLAVHFLMDETIDRSQTPPLRLTSALRTYVELLASRSLFGYALCGGLVFSGMFAYIAGSPFAIMEYHGLSASRFALLFGANAAAYILGAQVNAYLLRKLTPSQVLAKSIWLPPLAATIVALPPLLGFDYLPFLVLGLFLFLASLGFIAPNTTALALQHHAERAGSASAVLGSVQLASGTLAATFLGFWEAESVLPLATAMLIGGFGAFAVYHATHR